MSYPAIVPAESILASRILIVDDSEFSRLLLRKAFENSGFHNIYCAHDGQEALKEMHRFNPQLIVLDLLMPNMNGHEFCEQVRGIAEFKNTPILVQTGVDSPSERNSIFTRGATDLIAKPVNADELMARARVHLEKLYLISDLVKYRTRVASELSHARKMQYDLLPSPAEIDYCRSTYNIDVAFHFEPSSEMSGDMWGFSPLSSHALALFVSDLSGHGITAALNAFRLHTLMEEIFEQYGDNPGAYLSALGSRLSLLLGKTQFATLFYGVIDTRESLLRYAVAATPHPLIFRTKSGRVEKVNGSNFPLGVHEADYLTHVTAFDIGDILILYSDAFTETLWKSQEFLNEDLLISYLEDCCKNGLAMTATSLKNAVMDYFQAYATLPLKDDLTLCVYQRL